MHTSSRSAFLLSFALLFLDPAHGAQWANTYGGTGADVARSVQPTFDGGYVVAGYTQSFGVRGDDPYFPTDNAWVLKLDAGGNVVWQKTYGATGHDYAWSVQPTLDGGYVVAGFTDASGTGGQDAWVLKLDGSGNVVWQRAYGGTSYDRAESVQPTADGGYVVAGYTLSYGAGSSDAWVLRLDATGEVVWQRTYGGSSSDYAYSVRPTADGGYIVAGAADSLGAAGSGAWVLKLDAGGNVVWQKIYGGGGGGGEAALSVHPTRDGGFIVGGATWSFGAGSDDAWLLKLDGSGNVAWQKTYGGSNLDAIHSVQPTADGGYIVAGATASFGAPNFDAWVLKLDASGNVAWQKTYGGTNGAFAYAVQSTVDGGYVVAGETASFGAGNTDAWVLKLDADGAIVGCAIMGASSAVPANSLAIPVSSAVSAVASGATPVSTAVDPGPSAATPLQQCRYAVPANTEIPTLSERMLIILAILMAMLGFAYLRHRS